MTGQVKANELPQRLLDHTSQLLVNDYDFSAALQKAMDDVLTDYSGPVKLKLFEALRNGDRFDLEWIKMVMEAVDG